nr:MAG TPA: hypothetical protein [Caudoviricetes sp.]
MRFCFQLLLDHITVKQRISCSWLEDKVECL